MSGYQNAIGTAQNVFVGNVGTKSMINTMDTAAHGADRNFHTQTVVETSFDAVRLVLFNAVAGTIAGVKAAMGVSTQLGQANTSICNTPDTWADLTWSSASSVTQAAGTATRPSVTVSDWVQLNSVDRADGAFRPVLHTRIFVPSTVATATKFSPSGVATWLESETTTFGRPWRVMLQDGFDGIANKTSFTSTTTAVRWYPMAIQYMSRGKVLTLGVVGDSIAAGVGATNYMDSQYWRYQLRSTEDRPIEYANFGWSSQASSAYYLRAIDLMTNGVIPSGSVMAYHAFSPNDYSTSISAANINTLYYQNVLVAQQCLSTRVGLVLVDGAPANTTSKAWGTDDARRKAFNATLQNLSGYSVVPQSSVLSGGVDSTGQTQYKRAVSTDGLHPNDVGISAIVPLVASAVDPYVGTYQ